jgi:hypothetical protein
MHQKIINEKVCKDDAFSKVLLDKKSLNTMETPQVVTNNVSYLLIFQQPSINKRFFLNCQNLQMGRYHQSGWFDR